MLALHFANNVIAFVHVSWLDPNKIRRTTIVGSRKMLVYDDTALQEKIRIYDKGVDVQPYYDTFGDFQFSYRYGDIQIPRIEESEPLKVECEHFVDCIRNGKTPRTDGLSGARVVSVLRRGKPFAEKRRRAKSRSKTPARVERMNIGVARYRGWLAWPTTSASARARAPEPVRQSLRLRGRRRYPHRRLRRGPARRRASASAARFRVTPSSARG